MTPFEPRKYRASAHGAGLSAFQVVVRETDLFIHADADLSEKARELVLKHRRYLESYIDSDPGFVSAMDPWPGSGPAPEIVREMIAAGNTAGVGPMAAVAGAVAQKVGEGLYPYTKNVIVENGGDVFIRTAAPVTVGVYAGRSPLSMKMGLTLTPDEMPVGVCTSSGTIGHSKSFGRADAAVVVASSCALADAAATAVGNRVTGPADVEKGIAFGRNIRGVRGLVVVAGDRMAMWGDIRVAPLPARKS